MRVFSKTNNLNLALILVNDQRFRSAKQLLLIFLLAHQRITQLFVGFASRVLRISFMSGFFYASLIVKKSPQRWSSKARRAM